VNLQQRHFVPLDERFDEQIAAIHRLAFDGFYQDAFDVAVLG
jgi:hypothetical protein